MRRLYFILASFFLFTAGAFFGFIVMLDHIARKAGRPETVEGPVSIGGITSLFCLAFWAVFTLALHKDRELNG